MSAGKTDAAARDDMPKACFNAVALWIRDQVVRHGPLDHGEAARRVSILFGPRFVRRRASDGTTILVQPVRRRVKNISDGKVSLCASQDRFRLADDCS